MFSWSLVLRSGTWSARRFALLRPSLRRLSAQVVVKTRAQPGYYHSGLHVGSARQRGLHLSIRLIPELAICTIAIPAIVSQRDSIHADELKTPQQLVVLGYELPAAAHLDFDQTLELLEESVSPV